MSDIFSPEDFADKVDSLYRLVIICARRASQIAKPESRPLVPVRSKKATMVALEEVLQGKVTYQTVTDDDHGFVE